MSLTEPTKPASLPGIKSLLVFWIVFGVLGFCGIYVISSIKKLDSTVHWEKVVHAPPKMDKLLGDYDGLILVRTISGQILSCNSSNQDECWIPAIHQLNRKNECDPKSNYFNPQTHPPRNFVDCVDKYIASTEDPFLLVYALDKEGYIWRLESEDFGGRIDPRILAPFFGIFGLLIGSGVWTIWWYLRKRSLSKELLPTTNRIKSLILWSIVILPMCFLITRCSPRINYLSLFSTDPTANAIGTSIAQPFLVAVTPNPSGPAYNFASECSSAMWYVGYQQEFDCSAHFSGTKPYVDVVDLQAIDGLSGFSGQALQFNLSAPNSRLRGSYPVWKIQPGDHFQATLACKSDIADCNLVFSLFLIRRDLSGILQGQWEVTGDRPTREIDVELSKFIGQQVLFQLYVFKTDFAGQFPSILLINPRIINFPDN